MAFTFKNIDNEYIKVRHEVIGDIQPKYWFARYGNSAEKCLVKRSHSQKVNGKAQKSKMYNHFGEYFGYLLAKKAELSVCPVELVALHDTKNKYSNTKLLYPACASYSVKEAGQHIYPGEYIVSKFRMAHPEKFEEILNTDDPNITNLSRGDIYINELDDNVDVVLASIANEIKEYELRIGKRTPDQIKQDIDRNLMMATEMIVYDCILGNSDRHSQNWSMIYDYDDGTVQLYPMYDNEAVLGLRKTEHEIREAVKDGTTLSAYMDKELFSRMGFAPFHTGVIYKNMLEHLVNKYPKYAIPAMKKITTLITDKDVAELYEASKGITMRSQDAHEFKPVEELPEEYAVFGIRLFAERRDFAKRLVKIAEKRQHHIHEPSREEEALVI